MAHSRTRRLSFFLRGGTAAALIIGSATVIAATPVASLAPLYPIGTQLEHEITQAYRSAQVVSLQAQGWHFTRPVAIEVDPR